VYSAILLNVKKTVAEKIYYPMKPVWEDIEFAHMCMEKKLLVLKSNTLFHQKKNLTGNAAVAAPSPILSMSLHFPAKFDLPANADAQPSEQHLKLVSLLEDLIGAAEFRNPSSTRLISPEDTPPEELSALLTQKSIEQNLKTIILYKDYKSVKTFLGFVPKGITASSDMTDVAVQALKRSGSIRILWIVGLDPEKESTTLMPTPERLRHAEVKYRLLNGGFWCTSTLPREDMSPSSKCMWSKGEKIFVVSSWTMESK
jgi:hypothetical protein